MKQSYCDNIPIIHTRLLQDGFDAADAGKCFDAVIFR